MSYEAVAEYFTALGMKDRLRVFSTSSATVEAAAATIGCEGKLIAKTLSFLVKDKPVLIVAAGDAKIDNKKYKAYFGTKAKMIASEEVESQVGHAPGGVCPFAVKAGVKVYLDESLRRFEEVYPAAGSSNSAVKLTIAELEKTAAPAAWVDVCKGWNESLE